MTINMQQFYQVFFEESDELLAEMETQLLALNTAQPDAEALNAIFRAAHSIKGGASTFGLDDLAHATHVLETLLDKLRKQEIVLTAEHVDTFLRAKDVLAMLVDGHRHGSDIDIDTVNAVQDKLNELAQKTTTPTPTTQALPKRTLVAAIADVTPEEAAAIQEGLVGYGSIQIRKNDNTTRFELITNVHIARVQAACEFVVAPNRYTVTELADTPLETFDEGDGYGFFAPLAPVIYDEGEGYGFFVPLSERQTSTQSAPDLTSASNHEAKAQQQESKHANADAASSIRVNIDKVDQLINLVGELVITEAMIGACLSSLDPTTHEKLLSRVSQLTRNTRDLQESVMSIRMMPMEYVFSRFPRMVRDLATKLGKQVELVTHGAQTELDKGLIERITDPLTHLIRNSIDHGIELPAQRTARGKTPGGRITLSAMHAGGHIIIEVSDDGAGLPRDRILAKARQRGLPMSENPSDAEIWQLIFEPGFSTADSVTDISGRGVGMDVVKRNITAMGGTVSITTADGFGTTITIAVPLTLAILDGMSIRVADEIYILPLNYVVESVQPANISINTVGGDYDVVKIRGQYIPLISIHDYFSLKGDRRAINDSIIVIVESDGVRCALLVDELVGQQQVVVKNLETNYKKVRGVSGATILGDGSVALIIDVHAVTKVAVS